MRSPKVDLVWLLLQKEILFGLNMVSFLVLICLSSLLLGFSFHEAVDLFSEASRSALQSKELAPGMNPYDGVFVPTFGGLYLVTTLFFPFVALGGLASERQAGSLKLMQQLRVSTLSVLVVKLLAVGALWLVALVPALGAILLWKLMGGHVRGPELANLLLGHGLYAFAVAGFAFFASALTTSGSTAAILVVSLTLGSWVLDFAAGSSSQGLLASLSQLSLTLNLRSFERGILSLLEGSRLVLFGMSFFVLSFVLIQLGKSVRRRVVESLVVVLAAFVCYGVVTRIPASVDLREDRRNSFRPEDEAAVRKMASPLKVFVHMTPDDSRYRDFERKVIAKLRRVVPHMHVELVKTGRIAFFGAGQASDDYGRIVLEYQGKRESTLSNSPEEIIPLLHRLAGAEVRRVTQFQYPGYPLVVEMGNLLLWFYFGIPLLYAGVWLWLRRTPIFLKPEASS